MNLARSNARTCHQKRPFLKEGQAFAHLIDRIKAGTVDPGTVPYRCRKCRKWHLGGNGTRSLERAIREGGTA